MLASRLRSALILISIVLACMYLDVAYPLSSIPGLWMIPFFAALALGTVTEACRITEKAWNAQSKLSPIIVLIAIFLPAYPEFAQLYENISAQRTSSQLTEFSTSSDRSQEYDPTNHTSPTREAKILPTKNNTWSRLGVTLTGTWFLAAWMGLQTMLRYQSPKDALGWLISCGLLLYLCVPFACWWIDRQIGDQRTAMLRIIGIALVTKCPTWVLTSSENRSENTNSCLCSAQKKLGKVSSEVFLPLASSRWHTS